jgi:hypothetical protein
VKRAPLLLCAWLLCSDARPADGDWANATGPPICDMMTNLSDVAGPVAVHFNWAQGADMPPALVIVPPVREFKAGGGIVIMSPSFESPWKLALEGPRALGRGPRVEQFRADMMCGAWTLTLQPRGKPALVDDVIAGRERRVPLRTPDGRSVVLVFSGPEFTVEGKMFAACLGTNPQDPSTRR